MDKETLSNYGWIIISVLIIAALISTALIISRLVTKETTNSIDKFFEDSSVSATNYLPENKNFEENCYFF